MSKKKAPAQDNSAIYEAQRLEADKNYKRGQIDRIFGYGDPDAMARRKAGYDETASAARDLNRTYLDEDVDKARSRAKIALFSTGQIGGSGDIEENANIDRKYNQGLLDIDAGSEAIRRDLEGSDEAARLDLLGKVDGSTDINAAIQNGLMGMSARSEQGKAAANGRFLGGLFDTGGGIYDAYQQRQGRTAAANDMANYPGGYRPSNSGRNYGRIFG